MITFLIILLIIVLIFQIRSLRGRALDSVSYSFKFSKHLVEPNEKFELISVITNESRLIVPFLKVEESLPGQINILDEDAIIRPEGRGEIKHCYSAYLMPRSEFERRVPVSLPKRGLYRYSNTMMVCGDFLGMYGEWEQFGSAADVVVYPIPANLDRFQIMLGGFFGEISVRRFIMEDPILNIGVREYTGAEPFSQISWKHSAKTARLMVKQFDYTSEPVVSVLLDISGGTSNITDIKLVEKCFSLARSVCEALESKKIQYDFISNAATANALSGWSYKSEGLGNTHLLSILEGLGRASHKPRESFAVTVEKMKKHIEGNRSLICIMPERNAKKQQLVHRFTELKGGSILFIFGEDANE